LFRSGGGLAAAERRRDIGEGSAQLLSQGGDDTDDDGGDQGVAPSSSRTNLVMVRSMVFLPFLYMWIAGCVSVADLDKA